MITYIVTRSCLTGVNAYSYHRETRKIGEALAFALPGFPVSLYSAGRELTCRRNRDLSRVSNSTPIYSGDSLEEFARVCRLASRHYRLHSPFGDLEVEYQDGIYIFGKDNLCIAGLAPVQKGSPYALAHPEYQTSDQELHMAMMTTEELPEDLALLMLSFPLLLPDTNS